MTLAAHGSGPPDSSAMATHKAMHLAHAGEEKTNVNLVGVKSLEEFRDRIRAKVEKAAPAEWVIGGGWDETLWPVRVVPTRWDVDEVSDGHPVFLTRVDGHIAVANTRAW